MNSYIYVLKTFYNQHKCKHYSSFEILNWFIWRVQPTFVKTGISNLKVFTFNGHLCNFKSYYDHDSLYWAEIKTSCTRNYERKISALPHVARSNNQHWWQQRTSPYPWCYYGSSWSYCRGFLFFKFCQNYATLHS